MFKTITWQRFNLGACLPNVCIQSWTRWSSTNNRKKINTPLAKEFKENLFIISDIQYLVDYSTDHVQLMPQSQTTPDTGMRNMEVEYAGSFAVRNISKLCANLNNCFRCNQIFGKNNKCCPHSMTKLMESTWKIHFFWIYYNRCLSALCDFDQEHSLVCIYYKRCFSAIYVSIYHRPSLCIWYL